MELEWWQYTGGIVAASIGVAHALKTYCGEIDALNQVPLVVYVFLCNLVLTGVAVGVMGAFQDDNPWHILVRVVSMSVGSVGLVSTATNLTKPLSETAHKPRTVLPFRGR